MLWLRWWPQAGVLYNILLETQACEVSQRIIAMDNASTNAGEMVGRFTLFYNRYVGVAAVSMWGLLGCALRTCPWLTPLRGSGDRVHLVP